MYVRKKGYNIVQRYNKTFKNMNKNVIIIEIPMKAVGGVFVGPVSSLLKYEKMTTIIP